jgi:hypothetical protein
VTATVRVSSQLADALSDLSQRICEGGSAMLLLRPQGDVAIAERGLHSAVLEVQEDFAQRAEASDEHGPPDAGEWDWTTVPAGLLIVIRDSNALERVLDAVVVALERHDVSGVLEISTPGPIRELPFQSPMIACRLRLAGHRLDDGSWQPDAATRDAMITVADGWCRNGVPDGSPALIAGAVGPTALDAGEDIVARVGSLVDEGLRALVTNVGTTAFRAVGIYADGGMVLVSGGAHIESAGWQREVAELIELLRSSADHLAYGYIRRGWDLIGALGGHDLPADWPLRPGTRSEGDGPVVDAERASDIFGVQLLGPDYPENLPATADWDTEQAGTGRRLLTHTELSAWFSATFVPTGQRLPPRQRPTPPILSKARDELAAILSPAPGV